MVFRVDGHVHTSETSPCGELAAADMVRLYVDAGFHGVVICDHYRAGFFERLDADLSWRDQLRRYLAGYHAARAAGEKLGLSVFPGVELKLRKGSNEYLLFGVDESWLESVPRLYDLTLAETRRAVDETGGLLIQAHPFRPGAKPADTALIHGVEAINGHPHHDSDNSRAMAWARDNRLLMIAGSDTHFRTGACRAGMVFDRAIDDSADLAAAIRDGSIRAIFGPDGLEIDGPQGDLTGRT